MRSFIISKCGPAVCFVRAAVGKEEEVKKEEANKDELSWPWSKKVCSTVGF